LVQSAVETDCRVCSGSTQYQKHCCIYQQYFSVHYWGDWAQFRQWELIFSVLCCPYVWKLKSQHHSMVLTSGTRPPGQVIHVLTHHASFFAPYCTYHLAASRQRSTHKCQAQEAGGVYE
jgi:hypothetical protein